LRFGNFGQYQQLFVDRDANSADNTKINRQAIPTGRDGCTRNIRTDITCDMAASVSEIGSWGQPRLCERSLKVLDVGLVAGLDD